MFSSRMFSEILALGAKSPRLSSYYLPTVRQILPSSGFHTMASPLFFQSSPVLNAEPLKKKKKIDPAIIRDRGEKRARRIMRDIRRLQKVAKKFKPISELEVPRCIIRDSARKRPEPVLTEDEVFNRYRLEKEWVVFKRKQHLSEIKAINRIMMVQERAMDELWEVSPALYEAALQVDETLIPFKMSGPTSTPPIENYDHPDGQYIDVTKQYHPIIPVETKKKKAGFKKK